MDQKSIETDFNQILETEKSIHSDLDAEALDDRAVRTLTLRYKKLLRSPAVGFEGMLIGASDKFDMVATRRKVATTAFAENPQQAIADGLTNADGIPLDNTQVWSTGNENPQFGHPLPEHSFSRTIYGVAMKTNGDDTSPKFFTMRMNGAVAENDTIPIFKPVKFRAIDRTDDADKDSIFTMNASSFTAFEEATIDNFPQPTELIEKFCSEITINIADLPDYHATNKADFNRICIIKGDVSTLVMEPTAIGSRRLVLESETALEDLESIGTTCWIGSHIPIDFGEESKIILVGRTSQGKAYANGAQTDELGDVMINTFGVYAIPEYKVEVEVEEITAKEPEPVPEAVEETKPIPATNTAPEPAATGW